MCPKRDTVVPLLGLFLQRDDDDEQHLNKKEVEARGCKNRVCALYLRCWLPQQYYTIERSLKTTIAPGERVKKPTLHP